MLEILEHLGAEVAREDGVVRVRAAHIKGGDIPRELCEATRTSFLFVGPLLSRVDRVKLSAPGGDGIGRRRLDAHFYGL